MELELFERAEDTGGHHKIGGEDRGRCWVQCKQRGGVGECGICAPICFADEGRIHRKLRLTERFLQPLTRSLFTESDAGPVNRAMLR